MASPEPERSTSGSSVGFSSNYINRNKPLPEQWTLPQEWNIEKRECYDVSVDFFTGLQLIFDRVLFIMIV